MATKLNRFGLALTVAFALGGLSLLLGPFFGLFLGSHPLVGFGWLGIAALMLSRWRRGNTEAARMARSPSAASGGSQPWSAWRADRLISPRRR